MAMVRGTGAEDDANSNSPVTGQAAHSCTTPVRKSWNLDRGEPDSDSDTWLATWNKPPAGRYLLNCETNTLRYAAILRDPLTSSSMAHCRAAAAKDAVVNIQANARTGTEGSSFEPGRSIVRAAMSIPATPAT